MDHHHNKEEDITLLSLAWLKIAKYWKWLIGFFAAILGMVLLKRSREAKILKNERNTHRRELEIIDNSSKLERESRDAALEKFEKTIKKIEKDFKVREEEISEEKREEIKKLVSSSKDDPEAIAEELAKILSIDFIKRK